MMNGDKEYYVSMTDTTKDWVRMVNALINIYKDAATPVVLADAQLNVLFANDCAKKLFPTLEMADGLRTMIPNQPLTELSEKLRQGESFPVMDASLTFSETTLSFSPVMKGQQLNCVVVHFCQLPPGKRANLPLQGPTKAVAAFTHQFRYPLSNVFGMLSVVNQRHRITQDISCDPYMEEIAQNCYQMLRGCINFTEVIKYNSGINDPVLSKVDIWGLLSGLCEAASVLTRSINIPLIFDFPSEPAYVECDISKITTVMLNLISNSCRFTKDENRIHISGKTVGDQVLITVSDKGLGVPEEYQQLIFEPFFSYDPDGMPFAGTGLGLTVAKQIIVSHGGTIAVTSVELEGMSIALTLPLCDEDGTDFVFSSDASGYLSDRFSPVYVGLSDVCRCPNP